MTTGIDTADNSVETLNRAINQLTFIEGAVKGDNDENVLKDVTLYRTR